jgi:two-component system, NarL family, nitrate/nitrite response regulator NarL
MSDVTMAQQARRRVRVLVADDHPLYREGVVRALSASGQVEIVAEVEDGRSAFEQIQEHLPDVALLDYKLPELDGVAITNAIVREELPTRVLLVSAFTDSGVVYRALETGRRGSSRRRRAGSKSSTRYSLAPAGRTSSLRNRGRSGFRDPAPEAERQAGAHATRAADSPS